MEEKEVDLRDYIEMLRKRWKIIVIIFLASTITATVVSFRLPKIYESSTMVRIGRARDRLLEEPSEVIEIFGTKAMMGKVKEELDVSSGGTKLQGFASKIKMKEKSGLLEIRARAETPEAAMALVEGVTAVLLKRHEQIVQEEQLNLEKDLASDRVGLQQMEKEIRVLQKKIQELEDTNSEAKAILARGYMDRLDRRRDRYEQLQAKLRKERMEESYGILGTKLVVPAAIPEKPIGPKKKQNVLIAGILGLFVGFVSAAIVDYFKKPSTVS